MNVPLTPLRFMRHAVKLYGRRPGVVCGSHRFTYEEFHRRVNRLSRALIELGIKRGDRVAFLSFNCHRLLEAYYGVVQMGAILAPLNIRLSAEEIGVILNDAEATALFFDLEFLDKVNSFRGVLKTVNHFVALDDRQAADGFPTLTYEDLLAASSPDEPAPVDIHEDDVAELFYTSGTTGDPKGVMLTHRNIYLHAMGVLAAMQVWESESSVVQLHTIPLFHVNGWGTPQTITALGGTHVMLRRFDPLKVLQLIQQEGVTRFSLVPTMANSLLNVQDFAPYDLSSVVMINLGGSAATEEMVTALQSRFKCDVFAGYGMTETSPVLTLALLKGHLKALPAEEQIRRRAMTGVEMLGVDLRVVDDAGRDVAPDGQQVGEIVVRSDVVMKGYWRRPEETAKVIRDGWFHTGDMATIDEENYVQIVDRDKDIIISGGENISSIEVERVLSAHPAVYECAVIAVPDGVWGEVPKALVVLKAEGQASESELIDYCRRKLSHFKAPRSVEFRGNLPKGGTGKILKQELKEPYWRGYQKRVH